MTATPLVIETSIFMLGVNTLPSNLKEMTRNIAKMIKHGKPKLPIEVRVTRTGIFVKQYTTMTMQDTEDAISQGVMLAM